MAATMTEQSWNTRKHRPNPPMCRCTVVEGKPAFPGDTDFEEFVGEPTAMLCRGHGLLGDGRKIRYYYCPECRTSRKVVEKR